MKDSGWWKYIPNLPSLVKDMNKKGEDNFVFSFAFNSKTAKCLVMAEPPKYNIYLASEGLSPFGVNYSVSQSFKISRYIEDRNLYRKLCIYLFNKPSARNDEYFSFYDCLAASTPVQMDERASYYSDRLAVMARFHNKIKIEELNKLYFMGWRKDPPNTSVTTHNYNKTKFAFGAAFAEKSLKRGISSRWTDNKKEENINDINELFLM